MTRTIYNPFKIYISKVIARSEKSGCPSPKREDKKVTSF
jgi:hypothetical protein